MKTCNLVCSHFSLRETLDRLKSAHRFEKRSAEITCPFLVWHFPLLFQTNSPIQVVEGGVSCSSLSVCALLKDS